MDSNKSFLLGLKILHLIGLDPTKRTTKTLIISGINCAWITVLTLWVIAEFFVQGLTLQKFAKQTQAIAGIIFCKYLPNLIPNIIICLGILGPYQTIHSNFLLE